jgi:thiol:disulfide interchange protein DsbC
MNKLTRGITTRTRSLTYLLLAGCFMILANFGHGNAFAGTNPRDARVEQSLRKLYPKLSFSKITRTEIDGLYEVAAEGRLIYFHPKTGYVFVGELVSSDGRSITRERMANERFKLLTKSDLSKAIKIGSGRNIVVEVTDPDCPYCRKMHYYWESRRDITRYIFFKPLNMHPDAVKKATYILAAADTEKALFEVYAGQLDGKREVLDRKYHDKGRLLAHQTIAEKLQVDVTPSYWVNGRYVSGANITLVEKIIAAHGRR